MLRGFKRAHFNQSNTTSPNVKQTNPTEMMTLTPSSTHKPGNVQEWIPRLETHVGMTFPHLKKMFTTVYTAADGHKYYSRLLEDVTIVPALTKEEEAQLSTTQLQEHQWKMTESREAVKKHNADLKAVYTNMQAFISAESWRVIEQYLQTVTQRGDVDNYFGVEPTHFTLTDLKAAEQPLELLTIVVNSHKKHEWTIPVLAQATSLIKMFDIRPIGNVMTKTQHMQKMYDEFIERGGQANIPEELLTAILFQKLPTSYLNAKNGLLNAITLGNTVFPTTRSDLASVIDNYKVPQYFKDKDKA